MMRTNGIAVLLFLTMALCSCINSPPLYGLYAERVLRKRRYAHLPKAEVARLLAYKACSPEVLDALVSSRSYNVRAVVARNPGLQERHITALLGDRNWEVRGCLALNPRVPWSHLETLLHDKHDHPVACLGENPNVPSEILEQLYKDMRTDLRHLLRNPKCPQHLLSGAARGGEDYARAAAATNPSLPPDLMLVLAQDRDVFVRRALVYWNPKITQEALSVLCDDSDENVRKAALNRLGRANSGTSPE